MKKKIAFLITAVMIFGTLPTSAFAEVTTATSVAKAASPVSIKTDSNVISMAKVGSRNVAIADIIIKESATGMLKKNKVMYLQVENLKFEDGAKVEMTSGDAKVKSVKAADDILKIEMERESSQEAAEIRITGLSLFLNSGLPQGDYSLRLITESSSEFKNNMFGAVYGDSNEKGKFDTAYVTLIENFVRLDDSVENKVNIENVRLQMVVGENSLKIGDKIVELSQSAYIDDKGNVMMPVGDIVRAYNKSATVNWDGASQKVTILNGSKIVNISIGSTILTINGSEIPMSMPAVIQGGTTFITMKDLGVILGLSENRMNFDEESKTISFL